MARLADSPDELYDAFRQACISGIFVPGHGIAYPVARLPGAGDFTLDQSCALQASSPDGRTLRTATSEEAALVHDALEQDQLMIVLRGRWGGSGSKAATDARDLQVLHEPRERNFSDERDDVEWLAKHGDV